MVGSRPVAAAAVAHAGPKAAWHARGRCRKRRAWIVKGDGAVGQAWLDVWLNAQGALGGRERGAAPDTCAGVAPGAWLYARGCGPPLTSRAGRPGCCGLLYPPLLHPRAKRAAREARRADAGEAGLQLLQPKTCVRRGAGSGALWPRHTLHACAPGCRHLAGLRLADLICICRLACQPASRHGTDRRTGRHCPRRPHRLPTCLSLRSCRAGACRCSSCRRWAG